MEIYADASFNSVQDKSSQIGYVISAKDVETPVPCC